VASVSQLTHKASLLLNVTLLRACAGEGEMPLLVDTQAGKNAFIHYLTVGTGSRAAIQPVIQAAWDACFGGWAPIARVMGDTQAIQYAAALLHTNFVVSCTHALEGRVKAHVKRWVAAQAGWDAKAAWPVQCAILGWNCKTALPAGASPFVAAERAALGLAPGDVCDIKWRKAHLPNIVRYYHRILTALRANNGEGEANEFARGFTLAPLSSVKRHFVTIDTKILRGIQAPSKNASTDEALWAEAFNLSGLRGGTSTNTNTRWEHGATVQTDGVSLCVKFKLPGAAPAPVSAGGAKKTKKRPRPSAPPAADANTVILAIDPGRSNLMHGAARVGDSGAIKSFRLTRAALYNGAGKPKADKRRAHWNAEAAVPFAALAAVTPKTADLVAFRAYLAVVAAHYAALWAHKLHARWGREDLRFHVLKHGVMDRWLSSVKAELTKGGKTVKVAYGAGAFSPTGHGESEPAPTAFQYKRVRLAFGDANVSLVNEDFTTKCCAACGARGVSSVLQNVYDPRARRVGARWLPIRGLKRCSHTDCCSFVDRDANAALNILAAYEAAARDDDRPAHLRRDTPEVHADPRRWELHLQRG